MADGSVVAVIAERAAGKATPRRSSRNITGSLARRLLPCPWAAKASCRIRALIPEVTENDGQRYFGHRAPRQQGTQLAE